MPPIVDQETDFGPGRYVAGAARVPGTPVYSSHSEGEIVFTFADNDNSSGVTYAIQCSADGGTTGFLTQSTGAIDTGAEDWQTDATWTTYITASLNGGVALSEDVSYKFRVKARNELLAESAYSDWSAAMMSFRRLAYGPLTAALSFTITTGNTLVSGLSITDTSKTVTVNYTLTNKSATTSRIVAEYKRSTDADYSTATKGSGGDAITGLTAAAAGSAHTFEWDTGTDLGSSAKKDITFRITPYDASPTGGDAATASTTTVTINNLPNVMTGLGELNSYTWDKDTTPVIIATMSDLVLGDAAFFLIYSYDSDGAVTQTNNSSESTDGWEYQQAGAGYTAVPATGVPDTYLPPNVTGNKVKYTFQTALATGTISFKILQAEDFAEES